MRQPEGAPAGVADAGGGPADGGPARFLIFTLGAQDYALPLEVVVEVAAYRAPTPVPGADRAVEGIAPLRGRMVTVIDTRHRLGLAPRRGGGNPKLIVVREARELVGLVVDAVTRVAPVATADLTPVPASLGLSRSSAFSGMVSRGGRCLLLIDPKALLGGADGLQAGAGERP